MYNFVIYTDGFNSIERMFFLDIEGNENVKIISKNKIFSKRFLQKVFRIHYSYQLNNCIELPFKAMWYRALDYHFDNDNPTIYIFFASWYYPGYFSYLRKKHKDCKLAFYFGDTIASKKKNIKALNIEYLKNYFDYVGSYNEDDVKKYNLNFTRMCYSKYNKLDKLAKKNTYDVVFIGAARNRFDLIEKCYETVKKSGVKYYFYIVSNEVDFDSTDENFVVTKNVMDFMEYLSYVASTKGIIEILDRDTKGGTLRFWDAIMYNKSLITNDKAILKSKYSNCDTIIYTDDFTSVDYTQVKQFENINYKYNGDNSPIKFISKIENEVK